MGFQNEPRDEKCNTEYGEDHHHPDYHTAEDGALGSARLGDAEGLVGVGVGAWWRWGCIGIAGASWVAGDYMARLSRVAGYRLILGFGCCSHL